VAYADSGGRDFDDRDTLTSPKVTIVNESFASKYLAGANPVGATLRVKSESKETGLFQIVGLAKDAKLYDLREEYLSTMFMPVTQKEHPEQDETILIRSQASLFGLISVLKSTVQQINRGIDMDFTPFDSMVEVSLQRDRLMAHLSGNGAVPGRQQGGRSDVVRTKADRLCHLRPGSGEPVGVCGFGKFPARPARLSARSDGGVKK